MSKDKQQSIVPKTPEEPVREVAPVEAPPAAAIVAAPPQQHHALTAVMESAPSMFVSRYRERLIDVGTRLPSQQQVMDLLQKVPDQYRTALESVLQKTMGQKEGLYSEEAVVNFPELRLYQGTGNDPNRPDEMIPGQFYLTSKETVGKSFEGTLLATWTGSTMWPSKDENARVPICHSMNRVVGSTFGECDKCPNKPWRNGQQTQCGHDVVAFMLAKNLKDIVLVRFAKTSEKTGKQLLSFAGRSEKLYSRWYNITSKAETHKKDPNKRWFLFEISPQEGPQSEVPKEIWDFCNAARLSIEATYILPSMAQIYRQAEAALAPSTEEPVTVTGTSDDLGKWSGSENV